MKKILKHSRAMADTKDLAPDQDTTKVYYADNSDRIGPELIGPLVRDLVSAVNQ